MALCCYSDDTFSVDKIRRRLKGALWLIDHYNWLIDAYMSVSLVYCVTRAVKCQLISVKLISDSVPTVGWSNQIFLSNKKNIYCSSLKVVTIRSIMVVVSCI